MPAPGAFALTFTPIVTELPSTIEAGAVTVVVVCATLTVCGIVCCATLTKVAVDGVLFASPSYWKRTA